MAQPHLQSGQIGTVLPLGAAVRTTPSYALLKARQLEVMRLVLLAGKSMPEHQVTGEITVQCLASSAPGMACVSCRLEISFIWRGASCIRSRPGKTHPCC